MKKESEKIAMTADLFCCPECGFSICTRIGGPNRPGRLVCDNRECGYDEVGDLENTNIINQYPAQSREGG